MTILLNTVTNDELADFVRKTHNAICHPACTARMGPDSDQRTVVDPQLRVRGVEGLHVADVSVLPFFPAVNANITCMMIGGKAADLLRA
jgi:choline dehydrogenase